MNDTQHIARAVNKLAAQQHWRTLEAHQLREAIGCNTQRDIDYVEGNQLAFKSGMLYIAGQYGIALLVDVLKDAVQAVQAEPGPVSQQFLFAEALTIVLRLLNEAPVVRIGLELFVNEGSVERASVVQAFAKLARVDASKADAVLTIAVGMAGGPSHADRRVGLEVSDLLVRAMYFVAGVEDPAAEGTRSSFERAHKPKKSELN